MAISEFPSNESQSDVFFKFHDGKFVVWTTGHTSSSKLTLPTWSACMRSAPRSHRRCAAGGVPAAPEPAQIDAELRCGRSGVASYPGAPGLGLVSPRSSTSGPTAARGRAAAAPGRYSEAYIEHARRWTRTSRRDPGLRRGALRRPTSGLTAVAVDALSPGDHARVHRRADRWAVSSILWRLRRVTAPIAVTSACSDQGATDIATSPSAAACRPRSLQVNLRSPGFPRCVSLPFHRHR